ncbi:hypothetical protein ACFQE1_03435 [Halobium palmae]|uniref:Uncharacterized protein n=1 Tax=Halobium palmae TaxID=1776492 RepID=A0ABD5RXH5_9EURY
MSSDTRRIDELSREELIIRIRELEERVDQLENKEYLKALIRQVVHDLERNGEQQHKEIEIAPLPVQEIARLPKDVAREQLSMTHLRARYVWRNFEDISHRVRDGRVVKAGELRRILRTREDEDEKIYTSTVGRVMESFVDLTREIAMVTKSDEGERRLFVPNDWKEQAKEKRDR